MTHIQVLDKLHKLLNERNKVIRLEGHNSNRLPDLNHAIGICEKLYDLTKEVENLTEKLKNLEVW